MMHFCVTLICVASAVLLTAHPTTEGWSALEQNRPDVALTAFRSAVRADETDRRAWLGMAYAHGLQFRHDSAWSAYERAMWLSPDPLPMMYAAVFSDRYTMALRTQPDALERTLRRIADLPDTVGTVRAMAYELLGGLEERRGRIDKARAWYDRIGAITSWRLIGPFENISASGHLRVFPPERLDDPSAIAVGASGATVRWFTPTAYRYDGWIDMTRAFPTDAGQFYAVTYAYSDSEQRVQFRIGTSGSFRLFVNNVVVHETAEERNNDLDTYIADATLARGWNRILVKVGNSELDRCNFLLRITTSDGIPVKGLRYDNAPREVASLNPNPSVRSNPYTEYFRALVQREPQHLEHHLLLAESHLRNDESAEGISVLRKALKRWPDNALILSQLMEAYQRAGRDDDVSTTIERISTVAPALPSSRLYRLALALRAGNVADVDRQVQELGSTLPEQEAWFDVAISVARQQERLELEDSLEQAAFAAWPDNVNYMVTAVTSAYRRPGGRSKALALIAEHQRHFHSQRSIALAGAIALDQQDIDTWRDAQSQIIQLDSASPGVYFGMSDVYANRGEFNDARDAVRKAIMLAPGVSAYWYRAGLLSRALGDQQDAVKCFSVALSVDPSNLDARDALRASRNEPGAFEMLPGEDIGLEIAAAPDDEDMPNADNVILVNDVRRIVHPGNKCEIAHEVLVKVLTTDGIDRYKEYSLPYGTRGSLVVEKSVVIKPDGTEVPADRNGSELVFKSLEPLDVIYVRYRVLELSRGSLSDQFYDTFAFNSFVPVMLARYRLLAPDSVMPKWVVRNGSVKPSVVQRGDVTLTTWELRSQSALEYEESMPSFTEVATILEMSTLKSWKNIVDWYYDIAYSKTKSTIEVREAVDELFADLPNPTEEQVIERVYRFITSDIRYSSVPFRQNNVIPQKARSVLQTRIGDCKDVATLCIAMLRERGITAWHVLVETNTSPLDATPLPSLPFDHAIAAVETKKGRLYLDLTADNYPIGSVPFGDVYALALLVKPGETEPFRLTPDLFTPNTSDTRTDLRVNADRSVTITSSYTVTGALTAYYRQAWKNAPRRELEKDLRTALTEEFGDVVLDSLQLGDLEALTSSITYTVTFTVKDFLTEAGGFLFCRMPWYDGLQPDPALSSTERQHALELQFVGDRFSETITITPPPGYQLHAFDRTVKERSDAGSYNLAATSASRTVSRRMEHYRHTISAEEYPSYRAYFSSCLKADRAFVLMVPKGTVIKTPTPPKR
jgi:tetratricopeptide (TPR) repeat protein/transglutaminase-like putative cysteine protease